MWSADDGFPMGRSSPLDPFAASSTTNVRTIVGLGERPGPPDGAAVWTGCRPGSPVVANVDAHVGACRL
jgi:hypothetical protein